MKATTSPNTGSAPQADKARPTHVRFLKLVRFSNGIADIQPGEVVRIVRLLGSDAAEVVRSNGDTWVEIFIGRDVTSEGMRAQFVTMPASTATAPDALSGTAKPAVSPAPVAAPGTPLPWHRLDYDPTAIYGTRSNCIPSVCKVKTMTGTGLPDKDAAKLNAAYIVHACNALPALVAERDALRAALAGLLEVVDSYLGSDTINADIHDTTKAARALLAQAQGGGEGRVQ